MELAKNGIAIDGRFHTDPQEGELPPRLMAQAIPTWRDRLPTQKKIAIVGKAPDTLKFAPWNDDSWQIWILNDMVTTKEAPRWDACFEIHSDCLTKHKAHADWLRTKHGKPIFTNIARPEIPDGIVLPHEEVTQFMGRYINNTVSWMIAVAILAKPDDIGLWGVNMESGQGEYGHQRPSCEYFAGIALGRGIRLTIPEASSLLKCGGLYGIETNPLYGKVEARLKELRARSDQARANETYWSTQRILLDGQIGELAFMEQFMGGMG